MFGFQQTGRIRHPIHPMLNKKCATHVAADLVSGSHGPNDVRLQDPQTLQDLAAGSDLKSNVSYLLDGVAGMEPRVGLFSSHSLSG